MSPTRRTKFRIESLLVAGVLAGAALSSGCGSDGAGAIHLDSPQARKKNMQAGAGLAPTEAKKPGANGAAGKTVPRSSSQNQVRKQR
jgi:hypothetical protein